MRRQDITAVIRLLLYSGWGRINKENAAEKEERPLAGTMFSVSGLFWGKSVDKE